MGKAHKFNSVLASRYSLHKPDLTISSIPNSIMSTDAISIGGHFSEQVNHWLAQDIFKSLNNRQI